MSWINSIVVTAGATVFALFVVEIGLNLTKQPQRTHTSRQMAGLPLHDEEHHFCKGPRDKGYFDPKVISREYANQQYFEFRNDTVSLHTFNKFGFRGPDSLDIDRQGVIVIGDSFVKGSLADDTETIPAMLDSWYPNLTFFNFGIGGHGPRQYLTTYQDYADEFSHDYVVLVLFLGNDAKNDLDFDRKLRAAKELSAKPDNLLPSTRSIKKEFVKLLQSLELGKLALAAYHEAKWLLSGDAGVGEGAMKYSAEKLARQLEISVTKLVQLVRGAEKELVLVTIPSREVFDNRLFPKRQYQYAGRVNRALMESVDHVANREGVRAVVHMTSSLQREIENEKNLDAIYGWPDAHLTEYGYFLTAREISNSLEKNYSLPASVAPEFTNRTMFDPSSLSCP